MIFRFLLSSIFLLGPVWDASSIDTNDRDELVLDALRRYETKIDKRLRDLEERQNGERALDVAAVCSGRLTLTSGTAITTSDVTGATTIYFTPVRGAKVSLYDGSTWRLYNFTELSIALGTLSSDTNYDVFIYNNSGTPALELSAAWSSDTARNQAISLQDGVYVKSAANTRRYLGTFRTTSTTTTEDSASQRFLWNYYNQVTRHLYKVDATASWTYATVSWRSANGSTANRVQVVIGLAGPTLEVKLLTATLTQNTASMTFGIAEDSVTTPHASSLGRYGGYNVGASALYTAANLTVLNTQPAIGFHYYQWIEVSQNATATLTYGSPNGYLQCGLTGFLSDG